MYLGIEIGGTKLQLGVGAGDGTLVALERRTVDIAAGAEGILRQIAAAAPPLIRAHAVTAVGFGFGGPIDRERGITRKSHQVTGWDDFPLAAWTRDRLQLPVVLNNDCDAAALGEAKFGAGRGRRVVFFVTVGTGVGGGLVIDGNLYTGAGSIAAEIGHLRPGLAANMPEDTVERMAAGPGIVATARRLIENIDDPSGRFLPDIVALEQLCQGDHSRLTAKDVALAAAEGNVIAQEAMNVALSTLGWAIAQVITLVAPDVVVVGGGVSLAGEDQFFKPLRAFVEQYSFPPLRGSYAVVPAALGEEVVVQGAIAAAAGYGK